LPNSNLTFEITESDSLTEAPDGLETLTRLRMKGFGLSIDDFGSAHSRSPHLSWSPVSEIKISREFVSGLDRNPENRARVEACHQLAQRLSIPMVAQGIENEEEWHALSEMGCELAQGYFVAPPMDAEQLLRWADKWQAPGRTCSAPQADASQASAEKSRVAPARPGKVAGTDAFVADADVAAELFNDYRETTLVDLADLDNRIARKDVAGIARSAHRICGASKVVAAHEVVAACDRVERSCIDGQWTAIVAGCEKLKRAANRTLSGRVAR
jgi:HPt (histidine-containing phosphotransfer) domain-containing protein